MIDRSQLATAPFVLGTVNYIDRDRPEAVMNDTQRERVRMHLVPEEVHIHDARAVLPHLGLDTTGFTVIHHTTRVRDFFDPQQVRGTFYPEAAEVVRQITGAVHVEVFGEAVRNARDDKPANPPVLNVHVDYDEATVRAKAAAMLPDDKKHLLLGRIMLVNLWRPITPVQSMPLAVCDASSVARSDLFPCELQGARTGTAGATGLNVAFNPQHRWFYVPDMQPQEMFVFRLCDTRQDAPQWTAHTAFHDPRSAPGAPGRQSIEVRTLAFLP